MALGKAPSLTAQAQVAAAAIPATLSALAHLRPTPQCKRACVGFSAPGVRTGWLEIGARGGPRLLLWFPSRRWLATTLIAGKPRLALPLGDPRLLSALPAITALGEQLTALTSPHGGLREHSADQALATTLMLEHLLPAAVAALGAAEATFTVPAPWTFAMGVRDGASGWVRHDASGWRCGQGWPAQRASASLTFASTAVAAAALAQRSDQLAEIAAGEIEVHGRVPLADAMAQLLERAGAVLRG